MVIAVDAFKIAYMALPKAACSSVKEALARLDPAVRIPPTDQITPYTWHDTYPTKRFRPHRWEPYETSEWFRFCVVRDPVQRLLSVYTNRVLQFNELKNSRKIREGRDYLPDDLPADPDPDFFFQHLEHYKRGSSVIKHHALGAWLFIGPAPLRYDRVYKVEDLAELEADLSARSGRPVAMRRRNTSAQRLTLDDLRPETIDALRPFLRREYAHLSEFYDNPLA